MFPTSTRSGFQVSTALALAEVAQAAYSKSSEVEAMAVRAGARAFEWIEDAATDTQGFIAANNTDCVIAFRGSESVEDFRRDGKFRRRTWRELSVHRGFADAVDSVYAKAFAALVRIHPEGRPLRIWAAGHSLGGALAPLFVFKAWEFRGRIAGVYTFGQPRLGDVAFANAYNAVLKTRTFRIVNAEDIIARTPPSPPHIVAEWKVIGGIFNYPTNPHFQTGYRHCGTEIFLDSFGDHWVDYPWYRKIVSDAWGVIKGHDPVLPFTSVVRTPLKKHFMHNYIARLKQAAGFRAGKTPNTKHQTPTPTR